MKQNNFVFTLLICLSLLNLPLPALAEEPTETQPAANENNRLKTLEGSTSPLSGQVSIGYAGSSLNHPFSENAPNPGNMQPPPLVTMSGTVALRYRFDKTTTLGIGTGITTQTPFQGPKNTTISDPYIDLAHSYDLGGSGFIKGRSDIQFTAWTNSSYREDYGYRWGVTASNEAYHAFDFGLTTGLVFVFDYNSFATDPTGDTYPLAAQTTYDYYLDPYFEYTLSKRVNLRSVIGIGFVHSRLIEDTLTVSRPKVYQTIGVGIAATNSLFIYPYLQFFPLSGEFSTSNTLIGFSLILNVL